MTQATRKPADQHGDDAITFLMDEHKKVKDLFAEFGKLAKGDGNEADKAGIVRQICDALTVHAQIEEEIFYPAVRAAIDGDELMDEADVEHSGAKNLIAQLMEVTPEEDDHYDAKVIVLSEMIDHHVKEEEGKMFPKVKKAKLDTSELGEELIQRRAELQAKISKAAPLKVKKAQAR
jgi:hemerythrin superfamily protein